MSKKRILLLVLISILIITCVSILFFYYIQKNNINNELLEEDTGIKEEIENEENSANDSEEKDYTIEYANPEITFKSFVVKSKYFENDTNNTGEMYEAVYVNNKLSIPEQELLEISNYIDLEKIVVLDNESFLVQYGEYAEGIEHGYYLVYDNGERYFNLGDISDFGKIIDVKIEGNKFTITMSKVGAFLDVACIEANYNDNAVMEIQKEFEYLGNAKFQEIKIIKEKALKDLLIEAGEHQSCSEYKNN